MDLLKNIRWPLLFMAVVSFCALFGDGSEDQDIELYLFNSSRLILVFWSGWLVIVKQKGGLWLSSITGALMLFLSHVLIKGGYFIIIEEYTAFYGVVISFVMFVWVAMVVSALGGAVARYSHGKIT